jgi:hypothetical protein
MTTAVIPSAEPVTTKPPIRRGVLAATVGAGVALAYGALLDIADVPMLAGGPGATEPVAIGLRNFAEGTIICTAIATVLAAVLARRATRPRRTFVTTTVALTLASVALPLAAGATATSTRLSLALGHVIIAAVVIPVLALALPDAPEKS